MAGLLIVSASSYAAGFATSFPQLVLARGFGGAGSALFIQGLMNRILRIIEPEAMGRATGAFRSSFLVGIGAGPVIGGIVADRFGISAPFHFYATGLLVATVIAGVVMRGEAKVQAERRSPLQAFRAAMPLFRDIRYTSALLATLVGWWTISGPAQIVGAVFAEDRLGFSKSQIGFAVTLLSVGEILVLVFVGRIADRYGRKSVLIPSLIVSGITTVLIGQIESMPFAFYPLMVMLGASIAAGGVAAGGLLADAIPKGGSGAAVGVNQMAGDLGYLLAPVTIGAIAEGAGYPVAYAAASVPAFLVLFVALGLPAHARPASEEPLPEPNIPVG
jgi:MFS family permease